jgi:serine protease AprX
MIRARLWKSLFAAGLVLVSAGLGGGVSPRTSLEKCSPALLGALAAAGAPGFAWGSASAVLGRGLLPRTSTAAVDDDPTAIWVYFRDKGERSPRGLSAALQVAQRTLRARTAWRRSKVRPANDLVDVEDLELSPAYTSRVQPLVSRVRAGSRWLNAMSVEASPDQVRALAALDCVSGLDLVRGFSRDEVGLPRETETGAVSAPFPADPAAAASPSPVYGSAYDQLNQMNVPALHQQGLSGRGVLVAMLDVGFRTTHEVFRSARLIAQWDFVFGDGSVKQDAADSKDYTDAHGTATWSLLGGFKFGTMMGPAFGADFILAKTEDDRSETPIEEDYWVAGLEWAESLGAEVVSSSLGYTDWYAFKDMDGQTAVTTKAANRAFALGVVVVNAAGNERRNAWGHIIAPADGPNVIAVGAVDSAGTIASFSSPGPSFDGRIKPEVCAWGLGNWIAANKSDGADTYTRGSGTSYATPLVGGVVALLLEAHRDWTPAQVRNALMTSAGNAAKPNNDFGWGIVNAAAAVSVR